ncbi:PAS domain S-box protein [Azospirillum sp. RWY-5-1]|uniref:histidine kinase n=1 Tax=Azospirillum oleiclasticum TaxID=2735135 RepID=A0ABX2T6W1_9PROT|nr:PAS domain S-box protein [Azospirillum oleiclasticum]NYZ18953.1 PAS domain S-box protein [Azospirillum oleiclasticum]
MSESRVERLRRRAEELLVDGSFETARVPASTFKEVVHELYVHQAELEIQNEELRGAQQALEASRQEYMQLFRSLPLACFTVNAAGIVGEANLSAERQFGLGQRRLRGRPLTLLVDPVDHNRLFASLQRLRDTGTWTRQEYRYIGAQGSIDGLTDAHPVALEDGEKGDLLFTVTDVTERNAWMRAVQAARDEAERARAAYHHILQSVADGIIGLDADARMTFANTAAQTITGFPASELAGRSVTQLFVGDGSSEGTDAVMLALADGRARQVSEQRVHRKGGGSVIAEFTVSPILEFGRITGGVIALRDVTARIETQRTLGTSEERHRTMVQALHEALVMRDAGGRVLIANGMGERLLTGPAEPLVDPRAALDGPRFPADGASTGRRFVGADGLRLTGFSPAAEAVSNGRAVIDRVVGVTGDDGGAETLWLRLSSYPVMDAAGRVESVVSAVTDVTALKSLERDLSAALSAKERFIASASHDLRQPVQALLLLAGLVLKHDLAPHTRRLAEQLRDTVVSLGGLLDALLDISRLEAGLVTPVIAPVPLGHMMDRLHREFAPVAASKGLRLDTVPVKLTLPTDGPLLERVIRNLLSNAIRYTRHGRVLFGARRRDGRVRLEVWDTGIGIAEDQIDRIFQDFYQVGNAARNRSEGLGMGLSIARRLVAMLGGSIDVTSVLGRGSRFLISFPLVPAAPPPRVEPAESEAPVAGPPAADGLVLLVEDDAVIRMALTLMLEDWGYRVVEAGTAAEAADRIEGGLMPDIVLADYRLPDGETGLQVMDRARARLGQELPGILLTGDTSSDRLREAAAAQCALLHKPIQPETLQATVRRSLNGG